MQKEQKITAIAVSNRELGRTRLERARGVWREESSEKAEWALDDPVVNADSEAADGVAELAAPPEIPDEARALLPGAGELFTLCAPSDLALFRCLNLPTDDPSELADMAALQLDKVLPLPSDEMSLATEVLALDEASTSVLACAVPVEALEELVDRLGLSRRRIQRIDVAALAMARLLSEAGELLAEGREAFLATEGRCVTILVFDGGSPVLVRSAGSLEDGVERVLMAIRLSLVETEVERGFADVVRLTLIGEGAWAGAGFAELAGDLGAELRTLSPGVPGPLSRGAALRSTGRMTFDLTPPAWSLAQADRVFRGRLLRVAGGALLAWLIGVGLLYGGPVWFERRARGVDERLKTLEPSARVVRDVRNRVRMIQSYMDRDLSPLETLRELSLLLPDGIEFSSFRYKREDGRLSVLGSALSTSLVYEFKQRVDASSLFAGSALVSGPTTNPRTRGADFELVVLFRNNAQ